MDHLNGTKLYLLARWFPKNPTGRDFFKMKRVTGKDQLPIGDLKFCWVIALRAEARPVINAFDMKIVSNKLLFPVYINS